MDATYRNIYNKNNVAFVLDCHDIAEILLKVALSTTNQSIFCLRYLL